MAETPTPARRAEPKKYAIAVRQEAVRLVESGLSQRAVLQQLGMSDASLRSWLRRYGTAVYQQMRRKLFTPAQKQQIVRHLLDGRLSEEQALRQYDLRCKSTLRQWVKAYQAREASAPAADPPAGGNSEVAALTAQLQHARWQIEALHTLIDQAEDTYQIAIRKKAGAKPSK